MATQSLDIELGTPCPDFQLKGVDEKIHRLKDYDSYKILVIAFTCNHCPYVKAYEPRINKLAIDYKNKSVAVICINSNDPQKYPDDSFEKMKINAKEKHFSFDYLCDETQEVARAFNAACTPEFYVYDENRILQYHGRLDDNQDPAQVKTRYIEDAIANLSAGKKPPSTKTHALGCGIKWR